MTRKSNSATQVPLEESKPDLAWLDDLPAKRKLLFLNCRAELQRLIQERRHSLTTSRQDLSSELTGDDGDMSITLQSQHEALVQQEKSKHQIREMEAALSRFLDGSYGTCEETGDDIEAGRLQAMPWTKLCADGAEIRERRMKQFVGGRRGAAWLTAVNGGADSSDEEDSE
jgi:DnaK suppressor protein